jgi:hypothetical protein
MIYKKKKNKSSYSLEGKKKKKDEFLFKFIGNFNIKISTIDKLKLSQKLNMPIIDDDKNEVKILLSIEESNVK